jgi:hypothetical protein
MSVMQIDYKHGTGLYVGEMNELRKVTIPSPRNYSYIYFARFEIHRAIVMMMMMMMLMMMMVMMMMMMMMMTTTMTILIVLQSIVPYRSVNIYRLLEGARSLHL